MGIFSSIKDKVQKAQELSKGKTKEEKRIIEQKLLQPEPLPKYNGKLPSHKSELHSRTALIVFSSNSQKKLISSILSVRTSCKGVTYITDISLLEWLATKVKEGVLKVTNGEIVPSKLMLDELEEMIKEERELLEEPKEPKEPKKSKKQKEKKKSKKSKKSKKKSSRRKLI